MANDDHELGDGPIEPEFKIMMEALARTIDEVFNGDAQGDDRAVGFVLLTFSFGENEGRCNFVSNGADRRDLVVLFKEMAARFSDQPEMEGKA